MHEHDERTPKSATVDDDAVGAIGEGATLSALFQIPATEQKLGRYVVLGTLGVGGMGTVLEAFDRTLDRRVAVKVLHDDLDQRYTARLLREAQAMAKLSHPNVVQVFEAGDVDGQTFIAMELIQGRTLRAWMQQEPRPDWRQSVKVFIQVGQGLAAAHVEGLIHRDFKPGNAILDDNGRARVLDFGLARRTRLDGTDEDERDRTLDGARTSTPEPVLDLALTRTGAVLGTPAYMPPEQMQGTEADTRGDQFSFCVSLWEALYGERPFEGTSLMALLVSMTAGEIRATPKGSRVPNQLCTVLRRGLCRDPDERWPSMDALLTELRRVVAPRTRRGIALGLTAGLAALGGLASLPQLLAMQERCSGARAQLDGIWDDPRRQQTRNAILGTALSYAPGTWERVEPQLDGYAAAWIGKHTEICEATTVRGEQTEEAMDLRMSCLQQRHVALNATVTVLTDADPTVVEKAVTLVEGLPAVDDCDDLDRLKQMRQRVPPPRDPELERDVTELRERLAEVAAELAAGRHANALEQVEPVVQRAEELGYGPLLAEALLQRGQARDDNDQLLEAEQDIERAFTIATDHGHDPTAAAAVSQLAWVVGIRQERHESGLVWGKAALAHARSPGVEATVEANALSKIGLVLWKQGKLSEALSYHQRSLAIDEQLLGEEHPALATSLTNVGLVLGDQGKFSEALLHHQRALAIEQRALGRDHPSIASILTNIGTLLMDQGKLEEALDHHQRALGIKERAWGRDHTSVATTLTNMGSVLGQQGKSSEALTHLQRALTIYEQTLGKDHLSLISTLSNISGVHYRRRELAEALALLQRALTIVERQLGKDHSTVASILPNLGSVLEEQGKLEEALGHYQRALVIKERELGPDHPSLALLHGNIGDVLVTQGELSAAQSHLRLALTIKEQAFGHDHPSVGYSLVGLTKVALAQRDFETARTHASRAVVVREAGQVTPELVAEARFLLARALWSDRAERARARGLAEQARETFAEHGKRGEQYLLQCDDWLASHRTQ